MSNIADLFAAAVRYHQSGELAQAEALYRQILQADPGHADAYHDLGLLVSQMGKFAAASELIGHAITLNPSAAIYHFNLGNILMAAGRPAPALTAYQQAVRLEPSYVDALVNLASALREQGQLAEAALTLRRALGLRPDHAGIHNNLGLVLKDLGQPDEAIACYNEALRLTPQYADALDNLSVALKEQGRLTEAAECCRQALRINPNHGNAHNSMGIILQDTGQWQEASSFYERALLLNPGHISARWNLCLLRLLMGDFPRGWADYEARWQVAGFVKRHDHRPAWDGGPLHGKTILIHAEQGLGDTLQFIRFAPQVKERGGNVVLECQAALEPLLQEIAGVDVVIARDDPSPPFDLQAPLLSLPALLGSTLATIPVTVPYINASPERIEYWCKELKQLDGFKIGIVWQGSLKHPGDRRRSVPLMTFQPLARLSGVRLISLQVGPGAEQVAEAPFPLTDLGSRFEPSSFQDLAGALANLDLVVAVDTAVVHLAGALGVPVWVALPFAPDWRWLLERADSPWYPSLRLFRQQRPGEWDAVFEKMAAEAHALAEKAFLTRE